MQKIFFLQNLRRRFCDGFTLGYNLFFPLVMILLLGLLTRNLFTSEITSYQYYCVVLIPYCTVLGLITAAYAGKEDAYSNTAARVLTSPITVKAIVITKVISCSIAFFSCSFTAFIVAALICNLHFTQGLLSILFFYLTLSICVASVGTYVGLSLHNFLVFKNIISIPVSIFAALGGVFYPFHSSNPVISTLIRISPFTRMNRAVFLALYDDCLSELWMNSVLLLLVSVVIILAAILNFKKEEYINGVIPGYEK